MKTPSTNIDDSIVSDSNSDTRLNNHNTLPSELMTEPELIVFLRIPQVSNSTNYHNVIENLKRMHELPRIHLCGKPLYPLEAIKGWIREKTTYTK